MEILASRDSRARQGAGRNAADMKRRMAIAAMLIASPKKRPNFDREVALV